MLTLAVTLFTAGTVLTAYGQQTPSGAKVTKAKAHVKEARKDLSDAKKVSNAEYQKFKKDADAKIASNSKKIAQLKATYPSNANSEVKADYYRKVAALEQKNNDLKRRIKEAKPDNNWDKFKAGFNHDMNEVGHTIKGLVTKS